MYGDYSMVLNLFKILDLFKHIVINILTVFMYVVTLLREIYCMVLNYFKILFLFTLLLSTF